MKPRKDKGAEVTASYYYLSNTFHQFDSTKAAVRYMISEPESYSQQDIKKLESKVFFFFFKIYFIDLNRFIYNKWCMFKHFLLYTRSFNTNISHQSFDYTITFMNSPHYNTNSKGDFVLETGLNVRFLDFLYTKIYNVNQLNNKNNT